MTAPRSFREAFTEDPADVKDRARLVGERDSARRWAAALENRIAKVEARIKHWDASLGENDYMLPRWVAVDLRMAMGMSFDEACSAGAALTGGGDE